MALATEQIGPRYRRLVCFGLTLGAILFGILASTAVDAIRHPQVDWPYDVVKREIVDDTIDPGGVIGMRRLIDYHEEDCWRQYDRRIVSRVQTGDEPGRLERFDAVVDQKLPVDLSGKWQTWSTPLPRDFPCGPAYLVETVSAACTWWQKHVKMLRKPDIITPFTVACSPPT